MTSISRIGDDVFLTLKQIFIYDDVTHMKDL